MRAPVRLRDDPSAPADVRELVQRGERSRPIPREARARSVMRLDRMIVVPAAAGLVLWAKGVAFAGLCVVGVVTAIHVVPALVHRVDHTDELTESRKPHFPPAAAPLPARPSQRAALPPPAASDVVTPAAAASIPLRELVPVVRERVTHPVPSSITPEPPPDRDPLEREAAMLEEARAMLDRSPRRALAMLDRHAAAFPTGQLGMERELLAVQALQRLGLQSEAHTRASALLRQATGSIYEPRVRAMVDKLVSP